MPKVGDVEAWRHVFGFAWSRSESKQEASMGSEAPLLPLGLGVRAMRPPEAFATPTLASPPLERPVREPPLSPDDP